MPVHKLNIGIAGAGISGLAAGLELQHAGYPVSIFEARERAGGRIQSLIQDGMVIEPGPEFIHGNMTETIGLLKKYNIHFDLINGKMYSAGNGHLREIKGNIEGWDLLLNKMKSQENDLSFQEFLERNFPGNRFKELKKYAMRFAEGYDLADVQKASTKALVLEWDNEESEQYRVPAGLGTLIRALEDEFKTGGGKIFFNHAIESVDWNSSRIILGSKGNQKISLDKLIISLPLGILNNLGPSSESLIFLPAIDEKQTALSQIGFGTVIKIIMIWDSAFWKEMIPDGQFIFSDYFIPTWWTQYPLDLPMLTGWLGGPNAARVADEPDQFFRVKAIESLATLFSVSAGNIKNGLKECRIFNWKNEPWSRGAYSYSCVGFRTTKAICRKSLLNGIYFAGEAYYDGPYPGTVEAAVVSGQQTARQMLNDMQPMS